MLFGSIWDPAARHVAQHVRPLNPFQRPNIFAESHPPRLKSKVFDVTGVPILTFIRTGPLMIGGCKVQFGLMILRWDREDDSSEALRDASSY